MSSNTSLSSIARRWWYIISADFLHSACVYHVYVCTCRCAQGVDGEIILRPEGTEYTKEGLLIVLASLSRSTETIAL